MNPIYLKKVKQLAVFFILMISVSLQAADKSGVSPTTISLPSGPGSVEGLGGSFQPQLNTGSAVYQVKIAIPKGVNNHAPQLALYYNSGSGDSPAGIGWNFGPGSIKRKTDRGLPRYIDGANGIDDDYDGFDDNIEELDRYLASDGNDLVTDSDGTFRSRIEEGFVRYIRHKDASADYWIGEQKNGVKDYYGITPNGKVTNSDGSKVYRWLLEKTVDINGNTTEYTYGTFSGSDNQKYLTEIRWGAGSSPWTHYYFVHASYETRPDWRKDFRSGFRVKTAHRLKKITVGVHGVIPDLSLVEDFNGDGETDGLIRRYEMSYGCGGDEGLYLNKVTQFGSDGINTLPPIRFDYIHFNPGESISAAASMIGSQNTPVEVMDNEAVELIDFNNDGLPDILFTDPGGMGQSIYLNHGVQGEGLEQTVIWTEGQSVTSNDGLSSTISLNEDMVHLADMDGDGLADLVQMTLASEIFYFPNQGDMSWGNKTMMTPADTNPPAPYSSQDVVTADMNFDKRIDIVKSDATGYSIWFNQGNNIYSQEVRTPGALSALGPDPQRMLFSDNNVRRADMNGDRMVDVIKIGATHIIYAANQGYGNFSDPVEMAIPGYDITNLMEKAQLHDINGDGLADLVIERAVTNELWYWLNLGTDELGERRRIIDMPDSFNINVVTRWADMNGNGTTDLVYADSDASNRIQMLDIGVLEGLPGPTNVLSRIDNGLGVVTNITYKSSSEYYIAARKAGTPWNSTIPFNLAVIAKEEITTGLDVDTIAGVDQIVKEYTYNDPYYDIYEKSFRGFAQAKAKELGDTTAPTLESTTYFFTGGSDGLDNDKDGAVDEVSLEGFREEEPLRGKIWKTEICSESSTLFLRDETDWAIKTLLTSLENLEVRYAFQTQKKKQIYEGTQTPEEILTTYTYDDFGNIIEEKQYGALSLEGDELFITRDYITDTARWIVDCITTETQTTANNTKEVETRYYYDGPAFNGLSLGQLDSGNLTRKEGWLTGGDYINLESFQRDIYGNVIAKKDGNGHLRSLTFDSLFHTYPITETVEIGNGNPNLQIVATYHYAFGKISESADFNGHKTSYHYDSFGRYTKVIKPGDSESFPSQRYIYEMSDPTRELLYQYGENGTLTLSNHSPRPSAIITKILENVGEEKTFDTIQYLDGAGRKLAKVEEGEIGFIVKEAVLLNARGKAKHEFLPFTSTTSTYQVPGLSKANTQVKYDATLREVLRTNPVTDQGASQNSKLYLPLQITQIDENSHRKTLFHDGRERIVKVHEYNDSELYITRYQYDILGNLVKITDAQNNIKTMDFDGLARKTFMNDPDKGEMTYLYNDAGNLIQTTDAKGQVINYTYDHANRILSEDYIDQTGLAPDVAYAYDQPSDDYPSTQNTQGKLSWVTDLSGGEFFSYDERGNRIWHVKRIKDGSTDTRDYLDQTGYDAMDRKINSTYPDGSVVTFIYNDQNLLESIPGYLPNIDYEANNQYTSITYVNGIVTTYTYDKRQRLKTLFTENSTTSADPLQNLTYVLDGVGNITSITDGRGLNADSPKNATQNFLYDDLDCLTQANGAYGRINYQYDKIGNMVIKTSPDTPDLQHVQDDEINLGFLGYGGTLGASNRSGRNPGDAPGPHAVTSTTSGFYYDYDDNGNMTRHENGEIYRWNFKDRLTSIQTETADADYIYDSNGQRTIKKVNSNQTFYYVSDEYEVRNGQILKFVFAGSRRIARMNTDSTSDTNKSSQSILLQPGWNFFSLNVQPVDSNATTVLESIEGKYSEIYAYNNESRTYQKYQPNESFNTLNQLVPGKGYLIHMTSLATLYLEGNPAEAPITLKSGWNLTPSPVTGGSQSIEQFFNESPTQITSIWHYDQSTKSWLRYLTDDQAPSFLSNLKQLEQGNGYWIKSPTTTQLEIQKVELGNVVYYHPDHLGSTNQITTQNGTIVSQIEYYPYGKPRYEEKLSFDPAYKYTDKELDQESSLFYYETRYLDSNIASFTRLDDKYLNINSLEKDKFEIFLQKPQLINTSAYTLNNSLKYIDPTGEFFISTFFNLVFGDSFEKPIQKFTPLKKAKGARIVSNTIVGGITGAGEGCTVGLLAGGIGCIPGAIIGFFLGSSTNGAVSAYNEGKPDRND